MTNAIGVTLVVGAGLLTALAPTHATSQATESQRPTQTASESARARTERTLFRLEDEWAQAVVRRDSAFFKRLLAPRFVYTENDQVMRKEELVRALVACPDTVESAGNEDLKAYIYGSTAVVTGILTMQGRGKDGAFKRRFRYTDTWMHLSGRWQVIAAHDYLMPR